MVLHTVNQSPFNGSSLVECLRWISAPAALLLIEDGVYASTGAGIDLLEALPDEIELYALTPDLAARGLKEPLSPRIKLVDDQGFVELSLRCERVQSWY